MTNDPDLNPGGDGEVIDATEASSGQKTGHMRWVLGIGTALGAIALVVGWLMAR